MMYLISGQPGNGKTLRAIWHMQQEQERNVAAHKDGKEPLRRFFSNVVGSTTEDNADAFPWVEKLPEHVDWTKLPDGSYVLFDEAHADGQTPGLECYGKLFPSTGKPGESADLRIRAMSTHRHRGFDLIFVTQWPSKIHHQVRSLVGSHTHMNRGMGLEAAGVLQWTRVQTDPYDEGERDKAEEEIWRYPKDLYRRYRSSTLHTASHKFKIPKKVWSGLSMLLMLLLLLWGIWAFVVPHFKAKFAAPVSSSSEAAGGPSLLGPAPTKTDSSVDVVLSPGMQAFAQLNTMAAPSLAGCVSSDRGCRCFNTEGAQIDMARHECQALLDGPLPFNVYHEFKPPVSTSASSAGPGTGTGPVQEQAAGSVVGYQAGQRSDQFARSPGYKGDTWTPPTTTL